MLVPSVVKNVIVLPLYLWFIVIFLFNNEYINYCEYGIIPLSNLYETIHICWTSTMAGTVSDLFNFHHNTVKAYLLYTWGNWGTDR